MNDSGAHSRSIGGLAVLPGTWDIGIALRALEFERSMEDYSSYFPFPALGVSTLNAVPNSAMAFYMGEIGVTRYFEDLRLPDGVHPFYHFVLESISSSSALLPNFGDEAILVEHLLSECFSAESTYAPTILIVFVCYCDAFFASKWKEAKWPDPVFRRHFVSFSSQLPHP
jgi:hypothetical protein